MTYPVPLTPFAIQSVLQAATLAALGLSPTAFNLVRVDWQTQGQPTGTVNDDITYLRALEVDNPYNRVRDVQTLPNDSQTVLQLTTYTRVWEIAWTLYGPNSFDHARILRSAMFQQAIHDELALWQLYLVTDVQAPQRVPEYFQGQWWERVDFSVLLNEAVSETLVIGSVESVEVIIEDATSPPPLADFTVTA